MTSTQTQKCNDNDHNNLNKDKIISYGSKLTSAILLLYACKVDLSSPRELKAPKSVVLETFSESIEFFNLSGNEQSRL